MARVAAFVPDLLFGSKVVAALEAAGHDAVLVNDPSSVEPGTADVLVVDLTTDHLPRIDAIRGTRLEGVRTLGFYSHVEGDVRTAALQAGFDLVVPRSRMAREGAVLVERLSGDV